MRDNDGGVPSPRVPLPVARATEALFRRLSAMRGRRIFHPRGVGFELEVRIAPGGGADGTFLSRPAVHRGVARLSRAAGLPGSLPDVLGFAFRLTDVHGPGRHQDFLLVTSARSPLARHALLPAPRGFFGHFYSSLLPYSVGEKVRMVGLEPRPLAHSTNRLDEIGSAAPGTACSLCLASLTGTWDTVAEIELGERLPDTEIEPLRLDPWNTGGGIRPTGPLMGLRRPAYAGSQRGRGAR